VGPAHDGYMGGVRGGDGGIGGGGGGGGDKEYTESVCRRGGGGVGGGLLSEMGTLCKSCSLCQQGLKSQVL
jgi:hypothetical protein